MSGDILSAWRPLSEAPKSLPAYVETGHGCHVAQWDGEWVYYPDENPRRLSEDTPSLPIADTYELDRAVQGEIARAFGELLGPLCMANRIEAFAAANPAFEHEAHTLAVVSHRREALRNFRRILHTAMGGRIPDEVP